MTIEWSPLGIYKGVEYIPIEVQLAGLAYKDEDLMLDFVGRVAGVCYNSDLGKDACITRALNCIKRGHHSPWEHVNISILIRCDRGVTHALVRHRHCAFQQGSTIYQKYKEGITCIAQPNIDPYTGKEVPQLTEEEADSYRMISVEYARLLSKSMAPERARDLLPNNLASNIIITTNMREWQYILQRRRGPGDSAKMHVLCYMLEELFKKYYPKTTAAFAEFYEKHPL